MIIGERKEADHVGCLPLLMQPRLAALSYRVWLRLFGGRSHWHNRRFPPGLIVDCDHRRVLFSREGRSLRAKWYSALRDSERGRCHVVLSGPSVAMIREPARLGRAFSLWANGSPRLALEHRLRPSLYAVTDLRFLRNRSAEFRAYAATADACLVSFGGAAELLRLGVEGRNFVVFDDPGQPWRQPRPDRDAPPAVVAAADENLNRLRTGTTVATACVRAAIDLGFSEVNVFGLDLSEHGRFYREESPEPSRLTEHLAQIHQEFREIARLAAARGVRVVNGSPVSRLDESILPKRDPNEILSD